MNALITGATGYLGRELCKKLKSLGWKVYISNSKIANLENMENLLQYDNIKFDYIFHLAVVTKSGDYCYNNQGTQWEKNQLLNTNILLYWKYRQPQAKMVCMGSSCSYNPKFLFPEEKDYLLHYPDESLYTYAMTKRMLLAGLRAFEKQDGLKWLYFVPSTIYGPNFENDNRHFIFDFIRKAEDCKLNNVPIEIWGNGSQLRDLVYNADAAEIIIALLDRENEIFNLGSGDLRSMREYIETICETMEINKSHIVYTPEKHVGVFQRSMSMQKVYKALPDFKPTPVQQGLERTIQFYLKNYGVNK